MLVSNYHRILKLLKNPNFWKENLMTLPSLKQGYDGHNYVTLLNL